MRDAAAYAEYIQLHISESGKDGMPVSRRAASRAIRDNACTRWARRIEDPNWGRGWVLLRGKGEIVGHIELRGGRIVSELHRATLGMGMLRAYTRQGNGRRMLETALAWARAESARESCGSISAYSATTSPRSSSTSGAASPARWSAPTPSASREGPRSTTS